MIDYFGAKTFSLAYVENVLFQSEINSKKNPSYEKLILELVKQLK